MQFILDDTVTIGSILNALRQEGVKTSDVAKAIDGISEKPLRRALNLAGYDFQNKAPKGWHYIGSGEEPTEKSIFDYVKSSSSIVKRDTLRSKTGSRTVHTEFTRSNTDTTEDEFISSNMGMNEYEMKFTRGNKEVAATTSEFTPNSPAIHSPFTQNQTQMILEMLNEWQQKKHEEQNGEVEKTSLYERIKSLPVNDKTRKTIVIDILIGKRLDDFCAYEKVNKSDVMHLALMNFLNKY